jgi:hypothetical protein
MTTLVLDAAATRARLVPTYFRHFSSLIPPRVFVRLEQDFECSLQLTTRSLANPLHQIMLKTFLGNLFESTGRWHAVALIGRARSRTSCDRFRQDNRFVPGSRHIVSNDGFNQAPEGAIARRVTEDQTKSLTRVDLVDPQDL